MLGVALAVLARTLGDPVRRETVTFRSVLPVSGFGAVRSQPIV